jgi:hypothetical protein
MIPRLAPVGPRKRRPCLSNGWLSRITPSSRSPPAFPPSPHPNPQSPSKPTHRLDGTTEANNQAAHRKNSNNSNKRGGGNGHGNDDDTAHATLVARRAASCLEHAAVQLVPFGAQAAASAAAYRSGLVAAQILGLLLRVSSRTPVLGPCLGALGVGFASTLAGVAARHARKLCTSGGNPLDRAWWDAPAPADAALDCALGVVLHRALGGRFSSVMPSDLARPGSRALESLPASADGAYAAPGAKRELARIFRRDGCHHCGTRKGPVIGDHMPPNVYVSGPGPGTPNPGGYRGGDLLLEGEKMLARFRAALRAATGGGGGGAGGAARRGWGGMGAAASSAAAAPLRLRQRFYAQCQRCSVRQAVAVRTGRRTLVLHLAPLGASRPERAVGLAVGLRQGAPALATDSPVAIVAARIGSVVGGAAESAAVAVREHRERRRRQEEAAAAAGKGGGGGKGRGGGGAAAAGSGGGWGRGGNGSAAAPRGSGHSSNFAVIDRADGRLAFQQQGQQKQQRNPQALLAWAAAGGGGGSQQQQQQQQPQAFAAAAPVQGGLLAGPLYAEFLAAASAPGWGSDGGGGGTAGGASGSVPHQQHEQPQQRAAAAGSSGYDAALAAYVSPGGAGQAARARPAARSKAEAEHYPPLPLPAQYLSGGAGGSHGGGVAAAAVAVHAAPSTAAAAAAGASAAAPGELSGAVALGGPSVEDAKRRAQEAFDRHFAREAGAT